MTASVARISRSYPRPGTVASNDGHPDPQDPRIETKADKALALTVWAASPVLLVALAALLVCLVM